MRRPLLTTLPLALTFAGALACREARELPEVRLVRHFPAITFERPLDMAWAADGSGRAFVATQDGLVHAVASPSAERTTPFLDLRGKVRRAHNEEGLLALALHPAFARNGELFVFYSLLEEQPLAASRPRVNLLSRFTARPGAAAVDPATEEVLLRVEKPWGNHNGATVAFGPDGFLYLSLGDGGSAGDPNDNAQSLRSLLGKILRIDVDRADGGRPYAIPADNPFAGRPDARPEIWAYGLRNVWRMSFDRETGELWAGDVGQHRWEEIDLVVRGGNHGWRLREGKHAFKDDGRASGLVEPVVEYGRNVGGSVTGGHVYRGERFPRLRGVYVFADFVTGTFLGFRYDAGRLQGPSWLLKQPKNVASIAADPEGELYALAFDGGVYRIEDAGVP